MTYYVPDWDDKTHGLRVFEGANLCHIKKGGVHQHQHQLQQSHHLQSLLQENLSSALVPNHDVLDTSAHTGLQEDDGTRLTDDGLERSSIPALDVPVSMSNPCVQEDEMLSWLRYPLEDSFDRNYCSEMLGELTNPHVQLVKDVFLYQTMKEPERAHTLNSGGSAGSEPVGLQQPAGTSCSLRPATKSEAAMALGAGRAAGLLSQTGSEAFNEVHTHLNPCALLKSLPSSCMEPSSDGTRAVQSMEPIAPAPPVSSWFNFSHFSRPVATTLDSLRLLGAASGPTNVERARQPLVRDSQLPCEHSTGDSNQSMVVSMPSSQQSTEFISRGRPAKDGAVYQGWCLPTNLPSGTVFRGHSEAAELNSQDTCVSVSENVLRTTEKAETTVSLSCLSGSSSEKRPQEVLTPPKRSSSSVQYSEDVEDVAANAKKPPPGTRAVKRSRAAETHNESEKKRRNKINVRLKALQSLIPNSNKTDKASVLDEAIEYTKMLQAQVQFMSMKTGMFFPTMMPPGMHYVPVQQMATFGMGMGMGMGMDMGIGMHVTDTTAATTVGVGVGLTAGMQGAGAVAATLNLSPAPPQPPSSHAYAGARLLQTCSPSPLHDVAGCLPTAHISEPYKVMLAQQSQLQPVLMNAQMNANLYGASLQQRPPEEIHSTSAF